MDYKEIKKLMDDVGESKLSEVEIQFPDGTKISLKKNNGVTNCAQLMYKTISL